MTSANKALVMPRIVSQKLKTTELFESVGVVVRKVRRESVIGLVALCTIVWRSEPIASSKTWVRPFSTSTGSMGVSVSDSVVLGVAGVFKALLRRRAKEFADKSKTKPMI